jgi:hypothetical protein
MRLALLRIRLSGRADSSRRLSISRLATVEIATEG